MVLLENSFWRAHCWQIQECEVSLPHISSLVKGLEHGVSHHWQPHQRHQCFIQSLDQSPKFEPGHKQSTTVKGPPVGLTSSGAWSNIELGHLICSVVFGWFIWLIHSFSYTMNFAPIQKPVDNNLITSLCFRDPSRLLRPPSCPPSLALANDCSHSYHCTPMQIIASRLQGAASQDPLDPIGSYRIP